MSLSLRYPFRYPFVTPWRTLKKTSRLNRIKDDTGIHKTVASTLPKKQVCRTSWLRNSAGCQSHLTRNYVEIWATITSEVYKSKGHWNYACCCSRVTKHCRLTGVIDDIDLFLSSHFILESRHFWMTQVTPLPFPLLHVAIAIAIARHLSEML